MPLVDDPTVEAVVYWHGGRWVDGNGNEVSKKEANRYRKQMRNAQPNQPVVHDAPPDEPPDEDDDEEVADYTLLSKADLVAEVKARNLDGRPDDEKMPEDGTKAELVAALEADDAEE